VVSTPHDLSADLHSDSWKFSGELGTLPTSDRKIEERIRIEAKYFSHNAPGMRCPILRKQYLFIGSGVIEPRCKTVIGSRLKQSGTF
jgi:hypothetical protein